MVINNSDLEKKLEREKDYPLTFRGIYSVIVDKLNIKDPNEDKFIETLNEKIKYAHKTVGWSNLPASLDEKPSTKSQYLALSVYLDYYLSLNLKPNTYKEIIQETHCFHKDIL